MVVVEWYGIGLMILEWNGIGLMILEWNGIGTIIMVGWVCHDGMCILVARMHTRRPQCEDVRGFGVGGRAWVGGAMGSNINNALKCASDNLQSDYKEPSKYSKTISLKSRAYHVTSQPVTKDGYITLCWVNCHL